MSLVTLLLFWKFCHCNIFLSISITRPKITISYLLKPLCVWNSKISSEKDRVMLIHHIYFSHMPMAKFCHIPFCQGKESGLCSFKNYFNPLDLSINAFVSSIFDEVKADFFFLDGCSSKTFCGKVDLSFVHSMYVQKCTYKTMVHYTTYTKRVHCMLSKVQLRS